MDTSIWMVPVMIAFPLAYELRFTEATLSMGMELLLGKKWTDFDTDFAKAIPIMRNECRDTPLPTGFQDAITPRWKAWFAVSVQLGCVIVIGFMWWHLGWASGLGGAAIMLVGAKIAQLILPKPTGVHYRRLILRSMISRYANYNRDGDTIRAKAMGDLLTRAGIDVEAHQKL